MLRREMIEITPIFFGIAWRYIDSHADVLRGSSRVPGTRDEPLRTSAWEARRYKIICGYIPRGSSDSSGKNRSYSKGGFRGGPRGLRPRFVVYQIFQHYISLSIRRFWGKGETPPPSPI